MHENAAFVLNSSTYFARGFLECVLAGQNHQAMFGEGAKWHGMVGVSTGTTQHTAPLNSMLAQQSLYQAAIAPDWVRCSRM
jgi:hypothetical protein